MNNYKTYQDFLKEREEKAIRVQLKSATKVEISSRILGIISWTLFTICFFLVIPAIAVLGHTVWPLVPILGLVGYLMAALAHSVEGKTCPYYTLPFSIPLIIWKKLKEKKQKEELTSKALVAVNQVAHPELLYYTYIEDQISDMNSQVTEEIGVINRALTNYIDMDSEFRNDVHVIKVKLFLEENLDSLLKLKNNILDYKAEVINKLAISEQRIKSYEHYKTFLGMAETVKRSKDAISSLEARLKAVKEANEADIRSLIPAFEEKQILVNEIRANTKEILEL